MAVANELLGELDALAIFFAPTEVVTECRDAKDNKYLELALASGADVIVSRDDDLLVRHPWRGVRILRPAGYLAEAEGRRARASPASQPRSRAGSSG